MQERIGVLSHGGRGLHGWVGGEKVKKSALLILISSVPFMHVHIHHLI